MKIVFIAHPIGGDVDKNVVKVKELVKSLNYTRQDVVPFAPYLVDFMVLDDANPVDRARGFKNNARLILFCDEIWLYGDRISEGMWTEIHLAKSLDIPVTAKTPQTFKELNRKYP